ncbi:phospholipase A and acyltransferase 3-like [Limanda limanda]|uniref:phospholipase A and acyltransferase 3-like n=1 Tax=Limanda limanda TaxID=27771 RepID=UPI0029C92A97|nr:phospholipase A and acyltransferase 3-like [Limanda limanda]
MERTFNGKPGDLIEINRGPYKQWAVYIGENKVVHLDTDGVQSSDSSANPGSSNGKVKREKFTDVVGNHRYQVNNLLDDRRKARDPSIIVKEACAMVGRELPYDLVTYNCEHFAIEMRYGEAESGQFKGQPGDLIEIFRDKGYQHWAIYIGGNEVVHLVNEDTSGLSSVPLDLLISRKGNVWHQKFDKVVGNDHYLVNNLLDKKYKPREPSIIVKEACAKVGSELQYNVATYNCEHFATEMRYGKAESRQVVKAVIEGATSPEGLSCFAISGALAASYFSK